MISELIRKIFGSQNPCLDYVLEPEAKNFKKDLKKGLTFPGSLVIFVNARLRAKRERHAPNLENSIV